MLTIYRKTDLRGGNRQKSRDPSSQHRRVTTRAKKQQLQRLDEDNIANSNQKGQGQHRRGSTPGGGLHRQFQLG